jgi:hypothetical protein
MTTPDNNKKFLTIPQIVRETGIGYKALRHAIATGALPAYSAGTNWPRIRRSDFDSWFESTKIQIKQEESSNDA